MNTDCDAAFISLSASGPDSEGERIYSGSSVQMMKIKKRQILNLFLVPTDSASTLKQGKQFDSIGIVIKEG